MSTECPPPIRIGKRQPLGLDDAAGILERYIGVLSKFQDDKSGNESIVAQLNRVCAFLQGKELPLPVIPPTTTEIVAEKADLEVENEKTNLELSNAEAVSADADSRKHAREDDESQLSREDRKRLKKERKKAARREKEESRKKHEDKDESSE
ncbi:DNA-directed RNA polymerase I complex subunit Ker1 [Schizosaccharomyces japonicus yFS275]|uniref:DNA-directed RNA polymerase I complex subunit Ker1 n=1 Tax=Schizosaccharomyces japonicus (strain yFS275 / FY16936) TaxID=402676 RepID=B6K0T8_SCHJY|nr:DNA-directed RNA polymerase I complex subunit Ker1 [Schizosaccharomyces japonicus yFS275]EEB07559.1 DNA-directed RNA polymerase I complex subunit Ker1 [Schizosaccharomyces japonicus yFS275]